MKRISLFLLAGLISLPVFSRAQDAATEERLNQLSAKIDALVDAKELQNKRIEELAGQIRDLQAAVNKPSGNYASADDVKQLADKLKEVDRKRQDDNEKVLQELEKLGKTLTSSAGRRVPSGGGSSSTPAATTSGGPEKGFEYVVQPGDTLGAIVKAYRDKNVKVTLQQVLAANPGLRPETMKVGQKIFIPAAQ